MYSEQFLLYCLSNFDIMKLEVDKRKIDAIYVDKANLHSATTDAIIKLKCITDNNIASIISQIIGTGYYLNKVEVELIYYLYINNCTAYYKELLNQVSSKLGISTITVTRAFNRIRNFNIVYITSDRKVSISSKFIINKDSIDNAKFIIIEM